MLYWLIVVSFFEFSVSFVMIANETITFVLVLEKKFQPQDFLGYLVAQAMKCTTSLLIQRFKEEGFEITRPQWIILAKSYHFEEVRLLQSDVVEMMMGDKTGVTRAVDDLVKRGLLTREIDELDRRNRLLLITDKGREIVPKLMVCVHKTIEEATSGVAKEDLDTTKKVLMKMIHNINEINQER